MEDVWTVYQSILETKNEYLDIYLKEFDELGGSDRKGSDWVVQHISSALSKSQTSNEGLIVLNCYLRQASLAILEQKTSLWTNLTLKVLHSKKDDINYNLVYTNLSLLASNSTRSSDLSKSFASNQLSKIYESLSFVVPRGYLAALKCTDVCLRLYPGPSGQFRNVVEKFITKLTDTVNTDINLWSGKCFHLLQQVRGGGSHGMGHKISWSNYQERLLGSLHQVLDLAFSHCNELYRTDNGEKVDYGFPELQLSDEPTRRAAQIFVRLQNLVNYLITALRDPFPVAKTVKPKKILNFICRGLSVTCPILQKNPISDNLALGVLLPKMHIIILELLKMLVMTLKTNLRPHHLTILGLLIDTLNWTKYKKCAGFKIPLRNLRSKVYEIITIWCATLQNGSRIELFAETLLEQVFVDITPYQIECTLRVLSGSKKHMSKKARRQLLKAQNEQTNLSQSHSNDNSQQIEHFNDGENYGLCVSALKCLQQILSSAANFFKPTLVRMIHIKVIQICSVFYELPMDRKHLYYNWQCRLEIYNVVHLLITHPNHLCPPPTQMILHILKTAEISDINCLVQQQCAQVLCYLENIIHPRKEGLLFPVDFRDIRNHFIKFGKESLLSSGIFEVNNSTENDYINDDNEEEEEQLQCSEKTETQECRQSTVDVESTPNSIDMVKSREKSLEGLSTETKNSSEAHMILNPYDDSESSEKQDAEKYLDVSSEPITKRRRLESQHVTVDDEECIVLNKKYINGVGGTNSIMDGHASENTVNMDAIANNQGNVDLAINDCDIIDKSEVADEADIGKTELEKNMSNDDEIYADIEAAFVDELNN